MTLAFLWLWRVNPDLLSFISVEEGVLELLTAIILGSSFVLGLFFIIKHRQSHLRLIYISLPLLSMLAFLDEISYGQGILNFQTFSIFGFYIISVDLFNTGVFFDQAVKKFRIKHYYHAACGDGIYTPV